MVNLMQVIMCVSNVRLLQGTLRDFDHAIPPGCTLPWNGDRAGSVLFSPVGSDTTVGGLGCSTWGFLQISFSFIHSFIQYMFDLLFDQLIV